MSCAKYLLNCLSPPVYNCHVNAEIEAARQKHSAERIIPVLDVNRHCTLKVAEGHIRRLTGSSISDKRIIAVIRNPYTLEYSFYSHLQKKSVIERRTAKESELIALAHGEFGEFVKYAGYHRAGLRQEDYFMIDGVIPPNVEIIRFESLEHEFRKVVAPYVQDSASGEFGRLNPSSYKQNLEDLLDAETKMNIYLKHKYIFDNYYQSEIP